MKHVFIPVLLAATAAFSAVAQVNQQSLSAGSILNVKQDSAVNQALDNRQQAIVAIASYTGNGDLAHLEVALAQGLEAGLTVNEIKEVLVQTYAYAGFPRSLRDIQTFMSLLDKRKAEGINDQVGREATPVPEMTDSEKYALGKRTLAELTDTPVDAPLAGYSLFSPTIDRFLKEHLFADIFDRDVLTWKERELATVSILAGVGGVEPMAFGHMNICLNLGTTPEQLSALLDIVEANLGQEYAAPLREVLAQVVANRKDLEKGLKIP